MAISDLLKGCPLFFELYDGEIEKIVNKCNVYTFEKGDLIIEDGEEANVLYIMLEGAAIIQKRTSKKKINIAPLNQGDVFGEMILLDEKIRSADVVAEKKSHVLEIHYDHIFNLFKKEPGIFGLMILNLSRLLSKRVRTANGIIQNVSQDIQKLERSNKRNKTAA